METNEIQVNKCYLGSTTNGQFIIKVLNVRPEFKTEDGRIMQEVSGDCIHLDSHSIGSYVPTKITNFMLKKEVDADTFYIIQKAYQGLWTSFVFTLFRKLFEPEN